MLNRMIMFEFKLRIISIDLNPVFSRMMSGTTYLRMTVYVKNLLVSIYTYILYLLANNTCVYAEVPKAKQLKNIDNCMYLFVLC